MPDALDRFGQGSRELRRAASVSFQQVKRDTLRRFSANPWHAAQGIDQAYE